MKDYEEVSGPCWADDCGHGGYIGSFSVYTRNGPVDLCDLYLWEGEGYPKDQTKACIRFGRDGDYYSPGTLTNLIKSAQYEPYKSALAMLLDKGKIQYVKK